MAKCQLYKPIEKGCKVNCANCQRWNGKRCKDDALLRKMYQESGSFKAYDMMMRTNKGIEGPM